MPHAAACQSFERGVSALLQFLLFFASQFRSNPLFLICGQKLGFVGAARQQKISEEPEDYGRNSLQHQEPPPTADAQPVYVIEDETRNRSSQDRGNWVARQEQRQRPR